MTTVFMALIGLTTVWTLAASAAVWFVAWRRRGATPHAMGISRAAGFEARRRRGLLAAPDATGDSEAPGISVLKPLCGVDAHLEQNLESFFRQQYPRFELLFGVQDAADPALLVVRALMRRFPDVDARIVIHDVGRGGNPKVANLRGLMPHVKHDFVLISDTSVRAPGDYLSELAATMSHGADGACFESSAERAGSGGSPVPSSARRSAAHAESGSSLLRGSAARRACPPWRRPAPLRRPVGLVTNLFAGEGEASLGAALENVQLNGFVAQGAALPVLLGDAVVVGKSMFFDRRVFEQLGGFDRVRDVLAEDFIIGKMFQHAGYRVALGPTVLSSTNGRLGLFAALHRQLRWSMMRVRLRGLAFALEPLTSPLALLPMAWALMGPIALIWAGALLMVRDFAGWVALRGLRRAWIPVLLAPMREVLMLAIWMITPFVKHVSWRGHRIRLGAGTLVFQAAR